MHPDFGANWNGGPFGIPYIVVSSSTPRSAVVFDYDDESDPGPYPIPPNPPIEPGGDRHLLVVVQEEARLRLFQSIKPSTLGTILIIRLERMAKQTLAELDEERWLDQQFALTAAPKRRGRARRKSSD